MKFRIYYTHKDTLQAMCVDRDTLNVALDMAAILRDQGHKLVTMVADNENLVGKQGVDSVKDGKLPDGNQYDWTKQNRVGAAFKNK